MSVRELFGVEGELRVELAPDLDDLLMVRPAGLAVPVIDGAEPLAFERSSVGVVWHTHIFSWASNGWGVV